MKILIFGIFQKAAWSGDQLKGAVCAGDGKVTTPINIGGREDAVVRAVVRHDGDLPLRRGRNKGRNRLSKELTTPWCLAVWAR